MEAKVSNPLIVRCPNCGGEQGFDIVKQQYECAHCGSVTEMVQQKAEFRNWRALQQNNVRKDIGRVKLFSCPACGAKTMAPSEEVVTQCPFCQNSLIDGDFSDTIVPEAILPFKLTLDEAKKRLEGWLAANSSKPVSAIIKKNMDRFAGCYLPYHIVRGACDGAMSVADQAGAGYHYPFRAYINSMAVNASNDLDNIFLDGIEPFDFKETREFDYGFLNGQRAKIQNVNGEKLSSRIKEEMSTELYHTLSKEAHTKEISVFMGDNDNETIAALMPVYFVNCGNGVAAAVNGQTGKISVSTGKSINLTRFWWLSPTIVTVVLAIIFFALNAGAMLALTGAGVFGMILFAVAHQRHRDEFVREILTDPKTNETHNDTKAVFMEDFGSGLIPVKLKFFTVGRIIKITLASLAIIFLPYLIALPIQLMLGRPVSDINLLYGAAWFIIPVFFAILGLTGMGKAMLYGYPMFYEIFPDGTTKRRKRPQTEAEKARRDETMSIFRTKVGCFVIGFMLFLLIGSVGAMLSPDDSTKTPASTTKSK